MSLTKNLVCFSILFSFLFASAHASRNFYILNQCPYTVWAAAVPGGGMKLNPGGRWTLSVDTGTSDGHVWGRTNCNFDNSGLGRCETGDCNGLLQCQGMGQAPNTRAEYAIDQFGQDWFHISTVEGFNIPMDFGPTTTTTTGCHGISCRSSDCPNADGNTQYFCPSVSGTNWRNYRVVFCPKDGSSFSSAAESVIENS